MRREPATIVILAWNEWAATRACLDSLRTTVRPGDQVVVVDNGSTDQTPRGLRRYPWVEVLTNETNRGFAAGCNQGAAAARHELVVFLNNDTLPVGHWLDALLEPFADAAVGAAGSRSNFVSGPQLVEDVGYATASRAEVCRFERAWRTSHRSQFTDTDRLVGFCLAVRGDAFRGIGGFDEEFGIGGFEDDDLCTRLRQAGHRLVIAHGSYVHHDGHRSFDANGVDWFAVQAENGERYRTKHGEGPTAAPADPTPVSISACLIVRDEEEALGACLDSIAGVADEIVVYDTGSVDGTVALARARGVTVVEGYWDDDFGRARNAALESCTGSWVLQIDADEELLLDGDLRAELAAGSDVDAYVVPIDNVGDDGRQAFAHAALRLFRRQRASWNGRLHEHVVPRPGQAGLRTDACTSARLRHWGYSPVASGSKDKSARNLRVARAGVDAHAAPDGRALLNLARALGAAGDHAGAVERFADALAAPISDVDRRLALRSGANLLIEDGRADEAMAWVDRLRPLASDDTIVCWLEGLGLVASGEVDRGCELLATLDAVRDGDGYCLPAPAVLDRRTQILAAAARWDDALDCCIAAASLGFEHVNWPLAAAACLAAGDDGERLADLVPESGLVEVAGRLLPAPAPAADHLVEALWRRHPGATPLLAAAVRVAPLLDVERALEWSVRLRDAGLAASCPLVTIARDQRRPHVERVRAAAVVSEAFDAAAAHELVVLVASSAPSAAFGELLLEVDTLAPDLLPTFVELLASSPARCRALSDVLTGFGATDEAAIVAGIGDALEAGRTGPEQPTDEHAPEETPSPGVVVLGMHRSGTSAATRVLNLLGLRTADESDLMPADEAHNVTGFWESRSLSERNEELLVQLGGSWSAPPLAPLSPADVQALVAADRGRTANAFQHVHGDGGGWVWKDPRTCITFPFWAATLPVAPVVVLPYRNPLEVWRSLETRDGLSKAHALALWERYTRSALLAARGRPTLVCSYDELLGDPEQWCRTASAFLQENGIEADIDFPQEQVREFLDPALRHGRFTTDDLAGDEDITPAQRSLWSRLVTLRGVHDALDPGSLPAESHWVEPLFEALRDRGTRDAEQVTSAAPPAVPPCSIIIPLFNKVEYTQRCIESLIETTDPRLYELVIVDNGSTDGTEALLDQLEGDVVILRNDTNTGFAAACNQGARAARGEHLLFLNNDTEAHPDWLPPMLAAIDSVPSAVAVGSRLLFPDGTVQHAGVLIAEDRRPGAQGLLPFHRLYRAAGEHPEALQRGPVSVLTGASLLVRRDAFFGVGGFDEGFWNGYEDVDLCLKLRELGGTLVYEPASCLVHHESVSGPERFSRTEDNVHLLVDRWAGRVPADVVIDEAGTQRLDPDAVQRPIRPATAGSGSRHTSG